MEEKNHIEQQLEKVEELPSSIWVFIKQFAYLILLSIESFEEKKK